MIEKEDWRSVIGLVTNAKQVVSSVQDVAAKLTDYAKFKSNNDSPGKPTLLYSQCPQMCYNFCTVRNPLLCHKICCGILIL